jgi:hypothetical protein
MLKARLLVLPLFLLGSLAWAGPQTVDLKKEWLRTSLTNQFVYSSWKNSSPPFGTDQVHEGLSDLMDSSGASQLCFPSSMTTALVKQFAFQDKPVKTLKLPGLSANESEIDLNEAVRDFIVRCKTDTEEGTYTNDGANCLYDFYKESGVKNFEVKLIRTFRSPIATPNVPNTIKKVEISDITNSIDNGYDVIGFIQWSKPNSQEQRWKEDGGHFVNIFGYARQIPWKDMIILNISNPMRMYDNKAGYQAFDSVFAQVIPKEQTLGIPSSMGEIVLEGPGFTGKVNRGFISGLILFKAE